jgi:hypothetical protein
VLHGDLCTTCREAHANFADESVNDIWNEVVTFHKSQEVLKMLSN